MKEMAQLLHLSALSEFSRYPSYSSKLWWMLYPILALTFQSRPLSDRDCCSICSFTRLIFNNFGTWSRMFQRACNMVSLGKGTMIDCCKPVLDCNSLHNLNWLVSAMLVFLFSMSVDALQWTAGIALKWNPLCNVRINYSRDISWWNVKRSLSCLSKYHLQIT